MSSEHQAIIKHFRAGASQSRLLTHYRRKGGGPTAHEMRSGRKYGRKVAMFGERALAKVRGANGDDKFEVGCWLGKTDRADFHMVATAKGLKWTRTI